MDSPLWLQIASLVVVVLALAASSYQVWLARQQTIALRRTTEAALTAGQAEARDAVLYADPDLLAWHLRNRNCEGPTALKNKQRYFIIKKLISDETLYIGNLQGYISDDTWNAWEPVVKKDLFTPEAREMWKQIEFMYTAEFVQYARSVYEGEAAPDARKSHS